MDEIEVDDLPQSVQEIIQGLIRYLDFLGYSCAVVLCEREIERHNTFVYLNASEEDSIELVGTLIDYTEVDLDDVFNWMEEAESLSDEEELGDLVEPGGDAS